MIRRLELENFFSFRDPVALDWTVPHKAGERELFFDDPAGGRVNRVLAIFGANASGKTQFLKALSFLQWLLTDSAQTAPEATLQVRPFQFDPVQAKKPSRLALEFSAGAHNYRYEVEVSAERIHAEALKMRKVRWNTLFSRSWNAASKSYDMASATEAGWRELPQRGNASLLSWALLQEHAKVKEVGQYLYSEL